MSLWSTLGGVGGFVLGGPAGAAAGSAALGGLASANDGKPHAGFTGDPSTDPNNPNASNPWGWAGTNGGANAAFDSYTRQGAGIGGRGAPAIDYGGADRYSGMGDQSRGLGMDSRGSQTEALGLMRDAARGTAPSQAAVLMKTGADNAMASQLSFAANARGASGIAGANYNAAGNVAKIQTDNINNTGALRAQEMSHARDAFMSGASGIRAGDMQQRQQDLMAQGMSAQQAQAQASLEMQQRGLNQSGQQFYDQVAWNTRNAQLGSNERQQGFNQNQWVDQSTIDAGSRDASQRLGQTIFGDVLGVAKAGAGGLSGPPGGGSAGA